MKRTNRFLIPWSLIFVAVLILAVNGPVFSQDLTDEELMKKYEAIIGEYEFDLSETGGETEQLRFYIDKGELWVVSGSGDSTSLKPIENREFTFEGDDPDQGQFECYFLKDDEGQYSKCRVVVESLGLDIIGIKIGG